MSHRKNEYSYHGIGREKHFCEFNALIAGKLVEAIQWNPDLEGNGIFRGGGAGQTRTGNNDAVASIASADVENAKLEQKVLLKMEQLKSNLNRHLQRTFGNLSRAGSARTRQTMCQMKRIECPSSRAQNQPGTGRRCRRPRACRLLYGRWHRCCTSVRTYLKLEWT